MTTALFLAYLCIEGEEERSLDNGSVWSQSAITINAIYERSTVLAMRAEGIEVDL